MNAVIALSSCPCMGMWALLTSDFCLYYSDTISGPPQHPSFCAGLKPLTWVETVCALLNCPEALGDWAHPQTTLQQNLLQTLLVKVSPLPAACLVFKTHWFHFYVISRASSTNHRPIGRNPPGCCLPVKFCLHLSSTTQEDSLGVLRFKSLSCAGRHKWGPARREGCSFPPQK